MPQNISEFRIIGRIGKIKPLEKVAYVDVAANYNHREGDGWKTDTHWNSVVCFSNVRDQVDGARMGDLVHITGRVRATTRDGVDGLKYQTELHADSFSILARASQDSGDHKQD